MSGYVCRICVVGRVQGVGYRAFVTDQAAAAGLKGWVRNRRDGSVEAVLAGDPEVVNQVVAQCRRGPGAAQVENVTVEPMSEDALDQRQPGEAFSVLATI